MGEQQASVMRRTSDQDPVFPGGNGHNGGSGMMEVATSRAAQEVQAAMVIAKKYPRDQMQSYRRIIEACKRVSLAEQALYEYPKGGQKVSGASIRLAEVLSQCWGNFEAGVIELDRRPGESVAMTYAWDLETNARDVKVFTVKHIRDKRGGGVQLSDERDIYELIANMGARRKRACILALIPGDIQDAAEDECEKTLRGQNTEPLVDRARKMLGAFAEFAVNQEMIEKRLGHNMDAISEAEMVRLRKIYQSLKDGMATREDHFEVVIQRDESKSRTDELAEKFGKKPDGAAPATNGAKVEIPSEKAEQILKEKSPSAKQKAAEPPKQEAPADTLPSDNQAAEHGDEGDNDQDQAEADAVWKDDGKAEARCRTQARDVSGISRNDFGGGFYKFTHPKGGAPVTMTPELWRELFAAITNKRFDYKTGIITPAD